MDAKDNFKKILCYSMLNNKKCNYTNKCVYAHSLMDQKIEPMRHKVYAIIKNPIDLSNINLITDPELYNNLLKMTKLCSTCVKGLCPGGYNCRNGVVNIKYKVCYDDLVYGNCKKQNCQLVHLTAKGLVPFIRQKNKIPAYLSPPPGLSPPDTELSPSNPAVLPAEELPLPLPLPPPSPPTQKCLNYKKIITAYNDNTRHHDNLEDIQGVLLTEKFLMTHLEKSKLKKCSSTSSSEPDIDADAKMIEFLNRDDDSDNESIFLV